MDRQWQPSSNRAWVESSSGGWYLPVLVVDEEQMKSGGVRVMVLMKRVAVGKTAGGVEQAVGIRCRQEWHRHRMSREQLVGITGQRVQADGGREVLVEGQEVWEDWLEQEGQDVQDDGTGSGWRDEGTGAGNRSNKEVERRAANRGWAEV